MNVSSNPFGQSSYSPSGCSSVFGQTNISNNNPFAAKLVGSTSAGVFGTQASSPVFDASPAPAIGASSSPSFGDSSSSSRGSSVYGQNGGFGSTTKSSSIGSLFQQSQPACGSNDSSPFGSSSQPAFATVSSPAFVPSSTPAFGATGTLAFGLSSTPAFGCTSTPAFGNTGSTFDTTGFGVSTPPFGVSSTQPFSHPTFSVSSTQPFSHPTFSVSSTPPFSASCNASFGVSSTPPSSATSSSFGFWSTPTSGQSSSSSGSSPFHSSTFGEQNTTPVAYDGSKVLSVSAMPAVNEKSHEELRWGYYQIKNLGSLNPAAQSSGGMGFNINNTQHTNPFVSSSPAFGQSSTNSFFSTTSTSPFAPKTSAFGTPGFGSSIPPLGSSPFSTATSNPFWSTTSPAPSAFVSTPASASTACTSPFSAATSSPFCSTSSPAPSAFGSTPAFACTTCASHFRTATSNPFCSTTSPAPSVSGPTPAFASTTYTPPFGTPSPSPFETSTSIFRTQAQGRTSAFDTAFNFEKLESIAAMAAFKEKSHEEFRWESYQLENKGGPNPAAQFFPGGMPLKFNMNNTQQTNSFTSSSPAFGQLSANPFSLTISSNPLAPKTSTFGTPGSEAQILHLIIHLRL